MRITLRTVSRDFYHHLLYALLLRDQTPLVLRSPTLVFNTSRLEKLLTSFDARQVSDFWGFEPPILAVLPATLPLSYALKHKSLSRRVFDIQVSYPFSDVEAPERAGGRTMFAEPAQLPTGCWQKCSFLTK